MAEDMDLGQIQKTGDMRARLVPVAAVLAACALAFGNTLYGGFVSDDFEQVVKNPWIRDLGHIREIFTTNVWAVQGATHNYYRPLMHVFYLVCFQLFGLKAWGFHLANLLFHSGVSVLAYLATARLLSAWRPGGGHAVPALAAALLFAVHPVHTESVAWVGDITDLSFSFFYLLSFYLYTGYAGAGRTGVRTLVLSAASFFAATLCKETALTLPLLMLIYDALSHRTRPIPARRVLYSYIPYAVAFCVYLALRLNALDGMVPAVYYDGFGPYKYALNVALLFGMYVAKLFVPVNLNAYHVFHPADSIAGPGVPLSLFLLASSVALAVAARRDRVALFGMAAFIVPLLPAFYIYGIGESVFAERYLYLPVFGPALVAASAVDRVSGDPKKSRAAAAAIAVVAVLFTVMSADRGRVWRDDRSLWSDAVRKAPDAALPHYNLGVINAKEGRYDEAVEHLKAAIASKPGYVEARNNLAAAYSAKGMFGEAIKEGRAAIALDPGHFRSHYNLGMDLMAVGRYDEAVPALEEALRINPGLAEAREGLGMAYMRTGRVDDAGASEARPEDDPRVREGLERALRLRQGGRR